MRTALVAVLLSALLAAPAFAGPPALDLKPHSGAPITPGVKPKADDRFDLDKAPNLSQLTRVPLPLATRDPDSLTPEERAARCRMLPLLSCPMPLATQPRGEPKLYLLAPQLQRYVSAPSAK